MKGINVGIWFVRLSLFLLLIGLLFGYLGSRTYEEMTPNTSNIGFLSLRPLHVSSAYLGIISAGIGFISLAIQKLKSTKFGQGIQLLQMLLWLVALTGIFYSYYTRDFGGREYWEFNPVWAIPLFLSFVCFIVYFLHQTNTTKPWPVYYWMWFTGIVFFMFCFLENYLWVFPYFQRHFIADMTIQWKVNGSLVGAVNQMIYGIAFYLMTKIGQTGGAEFKREAFAMYFLGLFNLMFNWGHHIYLLPTSKYIHYVAYAVSMTEWIVFIRIIYLWRKQLSQDRRYYHFFPYRFLMASDYWVVINVGLALFISIPAINLYTHGTHFTVAHAMGTTIGINTMIILAAAFYFIKPKFSSQNLLRFFNGLFWITQLILFIFLLSLTFMGAHRSFWQNRVTEESFRSMFVGLAPYINVFILSGIGLGICLAIFFGFLLFSSFNPKKKNQVEIT